MRNVIVGTAGHIDHGKTSLVKALTGIDADRLKEEKQRGITIDIGFANLSLDGYNFGFVDVPGHERFIKNMLAGVHGLDIVMLVVAADEAIMPQTREHFDICRLLNVSAGLTVITKRDLVDEELMELTRAEVDEFVAGSFLEGAPVIAVSSKTGQGIDELKTALLQMATRVCTRDSTAIARLPIDRAFVIKGFGTVVTGTLTSGAFGLGDEVEVIPGGLRTRVRGLQVHNRNVEVARAGQRTAINLQGVALEQVGRGQTVLPAGRYDPTSMLDCELSLLKNAPRALKQRARVRMHIGTAELMARVVLLEKESLEPGERQYAQLRLESPTFALAGDRFIIRSYSPQLTIGGGVVIDPLADKHRKGGSRVLFLQRLAHAGSLERLILTVEMSAERGIAIAELAKKTSLSAQQLEEAFADPRLVRSDDLLLSAEVCNSLVRRVVEVVRKHHQEEPLETGIGRELVREKVFKNSPEVFRLVVEHAVSAGLLVAEKEFLRLPSHSISLSPEEEVLLREMEDIFLSAGYQAVTYDEAALRLKADAQKLRKLFQLLLNKQRVVRVGEFVFHRQTIDELTARIQERKQVSSRLDVAAFKEITGASRKYAIPLLEYLDSRRVTRRVGNDREIL